MKLWHATLIICVASILTQIALRIIIVESVRSISSQPKTESPPQRFSVALDSDLEGPIPPIRILTDTKTGRQYLMAGFVSPTICEINPKPLSEKEEK